MLDHGHDDPLVANFGRSIAGTLLHCQPDPTAPTGSIRPTKPCAPSRLLYAETQHGQMAAAAVIATIPALLLMALGQRFIVRGLTMGSVK
jgi:hypothetical protein